ncbi:hypothetical protein AB4144_40045, partial [Rhizobiaceae sp. 2RAB30]
MTPEAVRHLAGRMSETEFRQFVLERLGAAPVAPTSPQQLEDGDLSSTAQRLFTGLGDRLLSAVVGLPLLWERTATAISVFFGKLGWGGLGWFLLGIAAAFGAGIAAELLVDRLASRLRRLASRSTNTGTLRETLSILGA